MEWYFQKAKEKYNLKTAQGQRDFATFLLKEVARLPSLVEQDFWLKKISKVLDINLEVLRQEMKKNKTHLKTAVTAVVQLSKEKPRKKMLEERLLSLLAFSPDLLSLIIDRVLVEFFSDSQEKDLYLKFIKWYNQDNRMREKSDFSDWLKEEDEEIFNFFVLKELEGTKDFDGWTEEQLEKEIKFVVNSLRQEFLKERRIELSKAMEEAEKKGDREKILELAKAFEEINVQEN
jgi:DNA primase